MRTTFDNSISALCQAINDYFEYFNFTLYTLMYMVDISSQGDNLAVNTYTHIQSFIFFIF